MSKTKTSKKTTKTPKTSKRSAAVSSPRGPLMLCELRGFLRSVRALREHCPRIPRWAYVRVGRVKHEGFTREQTIDPSNLLAWVGHVMRGAA